MTQTIKTQITDRFLSVCDALMEKEGIKTDVEFSEIIGVNRRSFSDLRTHRTSANIEQIHNLAKAFPDDVDTHYIITGMKHFESFKSIYLKELKDQIDKLL